jgi:topoisomerase IA-like protein
MMTTKNTTRKIIYVDKELKPYDKPNPIDPATGYEIITREARYNPQYDLYVVKNKNRAEY